MSDGGEVNVTELVSHGALQDLENLHSDLDRRFRSVRETRDEVVPGAPVFALEHGLSEPELALLNDAVRAAVRQGFSPTYRRWSLPFVVYAAESGYQYAGDQYWKTFRESTPGWNDDHRDIIRIMFEKFASSYGGAKPGGAWARNFSIIAWPITHAILPADLQRSLARLLYEFRTGLTASLLHDPDHLGQRLAARATTYPERFRRFCDNTGLLGQVSVALLSGADGDSPYLRRSTLRRLVTGLTSERESRQWLHAAQLSAQPLRRNTLPASIRGVVPSPRIPSPPPRPDQLPSPTDPRLLLRREDSSWHAYADLPDLTSLVVRLPQLAEELRSRRAHIAGSRRKTFATGYLLYPQEVRMAQLPGPEGPFIRLERAPDAVNSLIADQCRPSPGPVWLFRCQGKGQAVEVKGRLIHPGASYVLVTRESSPVPQIPWVTETEIAADGVRAFSIDAPVTVSDHDIAVFRKAGILTASHVTIRPVGVVPSRWDGQGAAEWPAGESAMIGVSTDRSPETCTMTVDGQSKMLSWPEQQPLVIRLDDLGIGNHEVGITLAAADGEKITHGSLIVTIRDPHVRPEGAAPGEGIRLLTEPALPTFSDLWDGHATLSVDGPPGSPATLSIALLSSEGIPLAETKKKVSLPITPADWFQRAAAIRSARQFQTHYDDAESARITVSRTGIGFASLTCERGFQALRWRIVRKHDGTHTARLIDRTRGNETRVSLFRISDPLTPVPCSPDTDIVIPPEGGLLRATAGDLSSDALLPTQPTRLLRAGVMLPEVKTLAQAPNHVSELAAAHSMWSGAMRPADPFAARQQARVLEAITIAVITPTVNHRWAGWEKRILANGWDPGDHLDRFEQLVGDSPREQDLARKVTRSLYHWSDLSQALDGFVQILAGTHTEIPEPVARILFILANQPGQLAEDLIDTGYARQVRTALAYPELLRAARLAVLGTRAINGPAAGEVA